MNEAKFDESQIKDSVGLWQRERVSDGLTFF